MKKKTQKHKAKLFASQAKIRQSQFMLSFPLMVIKTLCPFVCEVCNLQVVILLLHWAQMEKKCSASLSVWLTVTDGPCKGWHYMSWNLINFEVILLQKSYKNKNILTHYWEVGVVRSRYLCVFLLTDRDLTKRPVFLLHF